MRGGTQDFYAHGQHCIVSPVQLPPYLLHSICGGNRGLIGDDCTSKNHVHDTRELYILARPFPCDPCPSSVVDAKSQESMDVMLNLYV